MELLYLTTQW